MYSFHPLGNQGNDWRFGKAELAPGKFELLIEATIGDGDEGDIAIDDIGIYARSCRGVTEEFDAYVFDIVEPLIEAHANKTGMQFPEVIGGWPGYMMDHTFKDWICYGMDMGMDGMGMDGKMEDMGKDDKDDMKEDENMMPMDFYTMQNYMQMQHNMIMHQHMMFKDMHKEMDCMMHMCMDYPVSKECHNKDLTGEATFICYIFSIHKKYIVWYNSHTCKFAVRLLTINHKIR